MVWSELTGAGFQNVGPRTPHQLLGLRHRRCTAPSARSSHFFGSRLPKLTLWRRTHESQIVQVKCLALDCVTFRRLLSTAAVARRIAVVKWLKNVPVFKTLNDTDLVQLVDSFETLSFREGDAIIQQVDLHTHLHTCAPHPPMCAHLSHASNEKGFIARAERHSDQTTSTFSVHSDDPREIMEVVHLKRLEHACR